MSLVQLHPEELLDRERTGVLSASERATLERHLASCAVCRFERDVRADFAAELDAPLPMHTGDLLAGVLDRVVLPPTISADALGTKPAANETPDESGAHPEIRREERGRTRRFGLWFLVAASLMVASAAVASSQHSVFAFFAPNAQTPVVEPSAVPAPPATHPRKHVPEAKTETETPEPEASAQEVPSVAPTTLSVPAVLAPATVAKRAPQTTVLTPQEGPQTPVLPQESPVVPQHEANVASASAVFADANAARRRGDHAAAATMYRALLADHPSSAEALAARATLGRMFLDDGDANGALTQFESYLASGQGALREEAMVGRARALERLGRATEERSAWNALLAAYPQTIHGERARGRLAATEH